MNQELILINKVALQEIVSAAVEDAIQPIKDVLINNSNSSELLTVTQAAAFLCISKSTLITRTKNGDVKSYKIGGLVRYKKSELETSLQDRHFCKQSY